MIRRSLLLFAAFACLLTALPAILAQDKQLTIDDIFDPKKQVTFSAPVPQGMQWLPSGKSYLQGKRDADTKLVQTLRVDAVTGATSEYIDAAKLEAALLKLAGMTADKAKRLAHLPLYQFNPGFTAILINDDADLYYYLLGGDSIKRLTNDPAEEQEADFSPDGRFVSFVRNQNLFILNLSTLKETALTTDTKANFLNGRLDWVYEEELYGRGNKRGYWWSPDSTHIAFLRLDEAPVHNFPVVNHVPRAQILEDTPYPLAGDPNPLVQLGIASVAPGPVKWTDTAKYKPEDLLIVRVTWSPDSKRVVYQAQDREQTFLDLNAAGADGKTVTLFTDKTQAWVEVVDNPVWLRDGSFLWRSERTGWMHVYHYDAQGKLLGQLTDGNWEVRDIAGVDEAKGLLYLVTTEHSPIAEQLYAIKLDGTGLTRITTAEGAHRIRFNQTNSLFFDYVSDINSPTQLRIFNADGSLVRVVAENKPEVLAQYNLGKPEFLKVKTRDGFEMDALMIKPPNFDPNRKYPVMSYTYSGPHTQTVRNQWGGARYLWHQLLAQHGYIVWICDNRSASGKGAVSTWTSYKNLGEGELRDLEDGVSYLKSLPYVDSTRIGLWGWSFGGFMTSYSLTHSTSFKLGIAGGTVTEWQNYDSIYTERYMLTPQHNPDGYAKSSVIAAAKNLNGKLLLLHGAIDDNVHMANTIQFMYELQKEGKQFQFMPYPKQRHAVVEPLLVKHMYMTMTDFILANL